MKSAQHHALPNPALSLTRKCGAAFAALFRAAATGCKATTRAAIANLIQLLPSPDDHTVALCLNHRIKVGGLAAIHVSIICGQISSLEALLECRQVDCNLPIHVPEGKGFSPLHLAIAVKNHKAFSLLLRMRKNDLDFSSRSPAGLAPRDVLRGIEEIRGPDSESQWMNQPGHELFPKFTRNKRPHVGESKPLKELHIWGVNSHYTLATGDCSPRYP